MSFKGATVDLAAPCASSAAIHYEWGPVATVFAGVSRPRPPQCQELLYILEQKCPKGDLPHQVHQHARAVGQKSGEIMSTAAADGRLHPCCYVDLRSTILFRSTKAMGPCGVGIFPAVKHSAENRLFWPYHWYTIGNALPLVYQW
jgi:hypothetical protein